MSGVLCIIMTWHSNDYISKSKSTHKSIQTSHVHVYITETLYMMELCKTFGILSLKHSKFQTFIARHWTQHAHKPYQYGVPINVFLFPMVRSSWADTPKSTNLMSALSVNKTFWPLMSLWMTLHLWRWLKPYMSYTHWVTHTTEPMKCLVTVLACVLDFNGCNNK